MLARASGNPLPLRSILNQAPSMRERFRTNVAQGVVWRQSVQQDFAKRRHQRAQIEPVPDHAAGARTSGGRASLVVWSGSFAADGVSDDAVASLFHGIYSAGLDALAQRLRTG